MEIINIPEDVRAAMYKVASINLCSNVNGQICTAMVMNPPKVSHPFQPDTFILLSHSLTHSLTRSLADSLTDSITPSFVHLFVRPIVHLTNLNVTDANFDRLTNRLK